MSFDKGDELECANCGDYFIANKDEGECKTEAEIIFNKEYAKDELAHVCNKCYLEIMIWFENQRKSRSHPGSD